MDHQVQPQSSQQKATARARSSPPLPAAAAAAAAAAGHDDDEPVSVSDVGGGGAGGGGRGGLGRDDEEAVEDEYEEEEEEEDYDDEDEDDVGLGKAAAAGGGSKTSMSTSTAASGSGPAPKKRKRASTSTAGAPASQQKKSCELCKARKVKCDRAEPACSWCARHNRTCVYLERHRPGSRIILGDELEIKVNRVYSLLEGLERRFDEHLTHQPPPQQPSSPATQYQYNNNNNNYPRHHQQQSHHQGLPPPPGPPPPSSSHHQHHQHHQHQHQHSHSYSGAGAASATTPTAASVGSIATPGATVTSPSNLALPHLDRRADDTSTSTAPGATPAYPSPAWLPPPPSETGGMAGSPRDGTATSATAGTPTPVVRGARIARRESAAAATAHLLSPSLPPTPPATTGTGAATLVESSSLSIPSELPPRDMLYTLVDLYFKHCNTWCPILDRKTTFDVCFHAALTEPNRVLLHAMVATTLRFYRGQGLSREMRRHYHAMSKRIVQAYAVEHITVPALRALLILCLDQLGTSSGPRGSSSLALVAHNVQQLGLCDESSVFLHAPGDETTRTGPLRRTAADQPPSWLEDEGRRRLCWMVYVLDRYATIAAITSDFVLDDSRMHRVLPCSYDLFSRNVPVETRSLDDHLLLDASGNIVNPAGNTTNPNSANSEVYMQTQQQQQQAQRAHEAQADNLGSFSYHCEIIKTLTKVHDFLHRPVDLSSGADMARWRNTYRVLDEALDAWLRSLPTEYNRISSLCHSDPGSRVANWFMLHSAYVVAVVRLHSAAAYPAVRSPLFVPSDYAVQRCLSAVQSLAGIVQDVREVNGLDLLGPLFAFSLWVGARVLLVHSAAFGSPLDNQFHFFIETLEEVGQWWDVSKAYAQILGRMVARRKQHDVTFATMRKNAFDLVNLASCTRRSGLDHMSTQIATQGELDAIEVFDFFNYPKLSSLEAPGVHNNLQS